MYKFFFFLTFSILRSSLILFLNENPQKQNIETVYAMKTSRVAYFTTTTIVKRVAPYDFDLHTTVDTVDQVI